jgi:hypothetical protein
MCTQNSTEQEATHEQGIVVPLELEGLRILRQEVHSDGRIRVEVMGTNERANCPHCGVICVKQHDVRKRIKRDIPGPRPSGRIGALQTPLLVSALPQSLH